MGSRPLWTNRAKCRNAMKKYEDAILDCDSALSINPKCSQTIEQKGNAFLGLGRFDEARSCFESLRSLGESELAESCLKKLHEIQGRVEIFFKEKRIRLHLSHRNLFCSALIFITVPKTMPNVVSKKEGK